MDLLPVGTVVRLKSGMKNLMIIGRYQVNGEDNILWDYMGCLHPEGVLNDDLNFLFNEDDIDKVIYDGYRSEDEDKILEKLKEAVKEFKENK